jgi:DNA-binding winged helix-turn-helix (wHTH) protein
VKLLYIVEEEVENDYHVMPFELLCDCVHITDFKDSWKHYLEVKPNIVMMHLTSDYHFCEDIINKIKNIDPKCSFLILAPEELHDSISHSTCSKSETLLFEPIQFKEMEIAIEEIINSMNILDDKIVFDPHNSLLIHKDKEIELTTKENKLLTHLIQNGNRIVSYDEIESYVWDNMYVNRNTLTSIVSNIRKKAGNPNLIKNHSNQGYKVATENILMKMIDL